MKSIIFICLILINYTLSAQSVPPFAHTISSHSEFDKFKGEPLTDKFSQVDAVKVVYVIATGKIYYINDRYSQLHFDFCKQYLNEFDDLGLFNKKNYQQDSGRKYFLGNINYFHSTGKYALEFSVADDISVSQIQRLQNAIISSFIPNIDLYLYVNTPELKEKMKHSFGTFKIIEPNEIYTDQIIQVVNGGQARGILKKIKANEIESSDINADDILLIEGYSNEIPPCSGVIITAFQTPLSHITILAHNRNTPVIAYKNAATDKKLNEFTGQFVVLTITDDTFHIELTEKKEKINKKKKNIRLEYDLSEKTIRPLTEIKLNEVEKYGAKSCYLAELQRVKNVNKDFYTPRGAFSIPFYYYFEHISRNGIDQMLYEILSDSLLLDDREKLNEELQCIRDSIKNSPLDTSFLNNVLYLIEKNGTGKRPRFRSSSNAEDLDEFNGAGLYESKTGIPGDTIKTVEKAIKEIWASLWNERAFREREYFSIDHRTALMAILVHESFPEEICNGVAITKNIYRNSDAGYIINLQKGETSVVQPPEGVVSEWMITYLNMGIDFYDDKNSIEYITYSSLNENKPILTVEQVRHLTSALSSVKDHFYSKSRAWMKKSYRDYALDIEFKYVMRNGKPILLIKQARPYR